MDIHLIRNRSDRFVELANRAYETEHAYVVSRYVVLDGSHYISEARVYYDDGQWSMIGPWRKLPIDLEKDIDRALGSHLHRGELHKVIEGLDEALDNIEKWIEDWERDPQDQEQVLWDKRTLYKHLSHIQLRFRERLRKTKEFL